MEDKTEESPEYNLSEIEFKPIHTTCTDGDHQWADGGVDPLSQMKSEVCVKCWLGRSTSILKI